MGKKEIEEVGTNFYYGSRSAIQKAIRRSDPALLKQSAKVLWYADKQWLLWRMPILAAEEVWQMMGDVHVAVENARAFLKAKQVDEAWRVVNRALREMCARHKDKAAGGLSGLIVDWWAKGYSPPSDLTEVQQKQWRAAKGLLAEVARGGEKRVWHLLTERAKEKKNANTLNAVEGARYRYFAGGMAGDQKMLVAMAVMVLTEGLKKPPIEKLDWTKKREGEWPWYCYDMHTRLGKWIMKDVMEARGIRNWAWFSAVWFLMESGKISPQNAEDFWWREHNRVFFEKVTVKKERWDECRNELRAGIEDRLRRGVE